MDVEVATVFVNFQVFVPFPSSQKELRVPYDLVSVARSIWNSEIVRNGRGEVLHCVMRFPPMTHRGVLYAGPVLTIRAGGVAELVTSGSVEAAMTFAHYARALLLDAVRCGPVPHNTRRTKEPSTLRHPLLAQMSTTPEAAGLASSVTAERHREEQRLLAVVRGERSEAALFTHTAAALSAAVHDERSSAGRALADATCPSVSFFNAIVRPDVHEVLTLQKKLGFKDAYYRFIPYGTRREPRTSLNVTGDTTVDWLRHFLGPVAHGTTPASLSSDEDGLTAQERAYLAPKRAQLARVLVSFSAQRFERQTGIQLVLNFSTQKPREDTAGHKRPRDAPSDKTTTDPTASRPARDTSLATLSVAPTLASVDLFFSESVLPPLSLPVLSSPEKTPKTADDAAVPATAQVVDASVPLWEESIKCSLFSTGNVQASAKSSKGLDIAIRLVLLPLLVCRAHIG